MDKEKLIELLSEGKTTQEIGEIFGKDKRTIGYWIKKYDLNNMLKYKKNPSYTINKIDSKEKAYLLGFIVADGHINDKHQAQLSIAIKDKEVVEYIASIIKSNVFYSYETDKKNRKFPKASTSKTIKDITQFIGKGLKKERHLPIVNKDLARFIILGVFDADGCITFGYRKDRNRLWHKVSFTSSYNILLGVQKCLLQYVNISTALRPKGNEDCFVLEFANKADIIKFYNFIYPDENFIILNRKYQKYKALRLKLEENGETA